MDRMTLLKELDEAGSTGLDMSPGDALARRAAAFIRDQALDRNEVLELGQYVNDAGIGGADSPHQVVMKLQAAIDRALKREPSAAPTSAEKGGAHAAGTISGEAVKGAAHPQNAVSAPDVAEMVKKLERDANLLVDRPDLFVNVAIAAGAMRQAAALLSKLGQGWVPVSERLPDEGEYVWCAGKHDLQVTSKFSAGRFCGYVESIESWEYDLTDKVTHWMPLPPLPKSSDE